MGTFLETCKWLLYDGLNFQIFAILPIISGTSTIVICYIIAVDGYNHIPAWFSLPEISLLGAKNPEHTIYQIGVTITFIFIILFYFSFSYFLESIIVARDYYISKFLLRFTVITLAIGLLFQGLITLTEDRLQHLREGGNFDTQSWIHRIFAFILFISALVHQVVAVQFYFRILPQLMYSKWAKVWILVVNSICIWGIVLFKQLQVDPDDNNTKIQMISVHYTGIFEWIAVFCILLFVASYSIDIYFLQEMGLCDQTQFHPSNGQYPHSPPPPNGEYIPVNNNDDYHDNYDNNNDRNRNRNNRRSMRENVRELRNQYPGYAQQQTPMVNGVGNGYVAP